MHGVRLSLKSPRSPDLEMELFFVGLTVLSFDCLAVFVGLSVGGDAAGGRSPSVQAAKIRSGRAHRIFVTMMIERSSILVRR